MKKTIKLFLAFIGLIIISATTVITIISCSSNNSYVKTNNSNINNKQTKNNNIGSSQKNSTSSSTISNNLQPCNNENFVISYNKLNQSIIKNNDNNKPYTSYDKALNEWTKIYAKLTSNKNTYEKVINTAIKSTIFNLFPNINTLVSEIKNEVRNNKITINELNTGIIHVKYMHNYYLDLFFAKNNDQFYSLIPNFYYTYIPIFNKNSFNLTINLNFGIYLYDFSTNKKEIVYTSNFVWELQNIKTSVFLSNQIPSRFSLTGVINQKNIFGNLEFNFVNKVLFKQNNTKQQRVSPL